MSGGRTSGGESHKYLHLEEFLFEYLEGAVPAYWTMMRHLHSVCALSHLLRTSSCKDAVKFQLNVVEENATTLHAPNSLVLAELQHPMVVMVTDFAPCTRPEEL
jgi:hypothetical protein